MSVDKVSGNYYVWCIGWVVILSMIRWKCLVTKRCTMVGLLIEFRCRLFSQIRFVINIDNWWGKMLDPTTETQWTTGEAIVLSKGLQILVALIGSIFECEIWPRLEEYRFYNRTADFRKSLDIVCTSSVWSKY